MKKIVCVFVLIIIQSLCFSALADLIIESDYPKDWSFENLFPGAQDSTDSECKEYESQNFSYIIKSDKTAEIVSYNDPLLSIKMQENGRFTSTTRIRPLLEIPRRMGKYPVTSIGAGAFFEAPFTEIIIPDCVTSIGSGAFAHSHLKRISLPNSVTRIGDDAFHFCYQLTSVRLSDNLNSVGEGLFTNCWDLKELTFSSAHPLLKIKDGVLSNKIEKKLLWYPRYLDESGYAIPEGTAIIGKSAMSGNPHLISITIPPSVVSIEKGAFASCMSLSSVIIPDGITMIESDTFRYCGALSDVSIPESVTCIGKRAFDCCRALEEVCIPDHVETIDEYAFSNCRALIDINIPGSVVSIGEAAFSYCKALNQISFPESVIYIGKDAFLKCDSLSPIVVKDSYAHNWAKSQSMKVIIFPNN